MNTTIESQVHYTIMESPIGRLLLTGDAESLVGVHICDQKHTPPVSPLWQRSEAEFDHAIRQLHEYFAGKRFHFDLQLSPQGTAFQKRVWKGLCEIGYGKTCSYGELAKKLGNAKASRAVGMANGRNPISIIVPCHRVIGANGTLTGYGGGLAAKKWLLEHEARFEVA
jgi:methylated-DNA-[protein]-cysteine S-methyltransferase